MITLPWRKDKTAPEFPVECDEGDRRVLQHVLTHRLSMASRERLFATVLSCRHALDHAVPGDFVECGVWRGGNALIAADVFARRVAERKVWLFDTFAGMTAPTEMDFDNATGSRAKARFEREQKDAHNAWCFASLEDVENNFRNANLLTPQVRFVKGDVLKTLGGSDLPQAISVLRLDTDWYESTKKELEVLWPRLSPGGILMVDDYGHWGGAKQAVDEFFAGRRPFFSYIDYTGRLAVKS
jgi:O-methyltransferase